MTPEYSKSLNGYSVLRSEQCATPTLETSPGFSVKKRRRNVSRLTHFSVSHIRHHRPRLPSGPSDYCPFSSFFPTRGTTCLGTFFFRLFSEEVGTLSPSTPSGPYDMSPSPEVCVLLKSSFLLCRGSVVYSRSNYSSILSTVHEPLSVQR